MNIKKLLLLRSSKLRLPLLAVAVLVLVFFPQLKSSVLKQTSVPSPTPTVTENKSLQIEQKINYGTGKETATDIVEVKEGESVLDVVSRTRTVEAKEYSFGKLVEGIDGVKNGTDEKYWMFYINDEESKIGAAEYKPKAGDKIEWRFKTYEEQ